MSILLLTLSQLLLQEEGKNVSQHKCQSFVTIGLLKFNSCALILLVDRKIFSPSHAKFLVLQQIQCFVLVVILANTSLVSPILEYGSACWDQC